MISEEEEYGYFEMKLEFLKDQLMHDIWVELYDNKGKSMSGKLHVMVQWIHSGKTYYADFLTRLKVKIETGQNESKELESLLQKLQEPYGFLKYLDIESLTEMTKDEGRASVNVGSNMIMNSAAIEPPDPPYLDTLCEMFRGHYKVWDLLLILSLILASVKMEAVNQCTAIVGICFEILFRDDKVGGKFKILMYMVLVSLIHDLFWVFCSGYVLLIYIIGNYIFNCKFRLDFNDPWRSCY